MQIPILSEVVASKSKATEIPGETAKGASSTLQFTEIFAKLLEGFKLLESSSEEQAALPGGSAVASLEEEVVDGETVYVVPEEGLESAEETEGVVEAESIDVDVAALEAGVDPVAVSVAGKEVAAVALSLSEGKETAKAALAKAITEEGNADATSAKPQSEKNEVAASVAKSLEKPIPASSEPLPARVALAKLTELTSAYSGNAEADTASEEQSTKEQSYSNKGLELAGSVKASKQFIEAVPIAEHLASEVAKVASGKAEVPVLSIVTPTTEVSGTAEAKATPELPRFEAPTIRTVGDFTIRSVRHLLGSQQESIQIRLVPRSLGEMHIAVKTHGDGVEIIVSAANGLVRDVLESQLPGLKDALSREGVEVTRVSVHNGSMSDTGNPLAQSQAHSTQRQQSSGAAFSDDGSVEGEEDLVGSDQTKRPVGVSTHDGDLDLMA